MWFALENVFMFVFVVCARKRFMFDLYGSNSILPIMSEIYTSPEMVSMSPDRNLILAQIHIHVTSDLDLAFSQSSNVGPAIRQHYCSLSMTLNRKAEM